MNKRNIGDRDKKNPSKKGKTNFVTFKKVILRNDHNPNIIVNVPSTYVRIGNFIYKTEKFDSKWDKEYAENYIGLNLVQYNQIKNQEYIHHETVSIQDFEKTVSAIDDLHISLETDSSFKITTHLDKITKHIIDFLESQIVKVEQKISMVYMDLILTITIESIDDKIWGKVNKTTNLSFKYIDHNIIICNKNVTVNEDDLKITITKCTETVTDRSYIYRNDKNKYFFRQNENNSFPIIIDRATINSEILTCLDGIEFTNDQIFSFFQNGYEFTFGIKVINDNKSTKFKNTYVFDPKLIDPDTVKLLIESSTDNVIIVGGCKSASKICFSLLPKANQNYQSQDYIIYFQDIIQFIKKNIKTITTKQILNYRFATKELLLCVDYINPESNYDFVYEIQTTGTEMTKIVFNTSDQDKFILVGNSVPYEIEEIWFKIKSAKIVSFFDIPDEKLQILDNKKLEKLIRNQFPNRTAMRHCVKLRYGADNYFFRVKKMSFCETTSAKSKYSEYGIISPNTKINFIFSKQNKNLAIDHSSDKCQIINPTEHLEKYVGGLSDQLKLVVRSICLSRGSLRQEFLDRGLKQERGMIFYGPPGTGKTTLARNIGKILGCEGERFRLMSGPEIFSKWVGESESNVRDIFKPAKKAWKKAKQNAPTYMVVIDEIDAMLPSRSGSNGNPVRDSVVNQFLSELDGLETYDNLICVGITNRLELLDSAAIRPGRLGTHIKIDLPDKNGRYEIFTIHTSILKTKNKLHSDVDLGKLSEITDTFNGADIESVIKLASTYSLERLSKIGEITPEIMNSIGLITQKIF